MVENEITPMVLIEAHDNWCYQAMQGIALHWGIEKRIRWLKTQDLMLAKNGCSGHLQADGIIVDQQYHRLVDEHFVRTGPIVVISRKPFCLQVSTIANSQWNCFLDRPAAYQQAIASLREEGFNEFAWVAAADHSQFNPIELFGVLSDLRISIRHQFQCLIKPSNPHELLNIESLDAWISSLSRSTAVLTYNCQSAQWIIDCCMRLGRAVPGEIAVFSLEDDDSFGELCQPSISRIDASAMRVGQSAGALLTRTLAGDLPTKHTFRVPPQPPKMRWSTSAMVIKDVDVVVAVNFIKANAYMGINVMDVVKHLQISRRSLEQKFRAALRRTPADEIRRCRIKIARQLLEESSVSIAKIAHSSGFESCEIMSRSFRKLMGMPPSLYRRLHWSYTARSSIENRESESLRKLHK